MFDVVTSSYPLGEGLLNTELQTKSFECCLDSYWISPSGYLYYCDYTGTNELVKDDLSKDLRPFEWVKTGQRGKVKPCYFTGLARFIKAIGNNGLAEVKVLFIEGKVNSVYPVTEQYFDPPKDIPAVRELVNRPSPFNTSQDETTKTSTTGAA